VLRKTACLLINRWWDFTCTARTPPAGGVESDSQATYDDETSPASAFHSTETDDLGTLTCRWARSRRAARRSLRPDGRAPAHRDVHHGRRTARRPPRRCRHDHPRRECPARARGDIWGDNLDPEVAS